MADDLPETIEWVGQGIATRLPPRGMSDYGRDHGNAEYRTSSGGILKYCRRLVNRNNIWTIIGLWKAQCKGFSSKWKPTVEEAIQNYEMKKETK